MQSYVTYENPLVSVVIPTFNRVKYIGDAINSALFQDTDFPFEVIISDDGSSDGTVELAKSYGGQVRVLVCSENRGAAAARNAGVLAARGDIIAFLDSDDKMLPGRLQKQVEFLNRNENVGLVIGASEHESGEPVQDYFRNRGVEIEWGKWRVLNPARPFVVRGFLGNQSTLTVRKALFEEIGPYLEDLITLEDWEFMFRASSKTVFACYNSPLAWIRTSHQGRLGHSSRGSLSAPEVWRSMIDRTPDLQDDERAALESRYKRSVRGAISSTYQTHSGAQTRVVLRQYGSDLAWKTRLKWSCVSLLPSALTNHAIKFWRRLR